MVTGGLNHRYPTLYGQTIATDISLTEEFKFLIQVYWLIMNGFALILEGLEDFHFALFPSTTFLSDRLKFFSYLNDTL